MDQREDNLREQLTTHLQKVTICRHLGDKPVLLQALEDYARFLIDHTNGINQAMDALREQEQICRDVQDKASLLRCLGLQGPVLIAQRDWESAMAVLKKQETLCYEMGDRDALQVCFGNQALVLRLQGHVKEALSMHKQEEHICRELGDEENLAISLLNQASLLVGQPDSTDEALKAAREAHRLATQHGWDRLTVRLERTLSSLGSKSE